ncbi:MAG: hypothetical protein ACJ75J_03370 [Cytophagaceae bacterium]
MFSLLFGKQPRLQITFPSDGVMKLEKVKRTLIISIVSQIVSPLIMLGIFNYFLMPHFEEHGMFISFFIVAGFAFSLFACIKPARQLFNDEHILFDLKQGKVIRNQKITKSISDIKNIEVELIKDSESADSYKAKVCFVFRGEEMEIDEGSDEHEIYSIATQIADFLNTILV